MTKKMTMLVPVDDNITKQKFRDDEVAGEVIGPFLVHRESGVFSRRTWNVTHIGTGFAAQSGLTSKRRALWLAKKLAEFDVWKFTEANAVKEIEPYVLGKIKSLRADAMYGDMQGTAP